MRMLKFYLRMSQSLLFFFMQFIIVLIIMQEDQVFIKRQWFIKNTYGNIEKFYDIEKKKVLGTGSYGSVIKAKLKKSKFYRAIKIIPKIRIKNPKRLLNQIDIMKNLVPPPNKDHPNIIKLYQTFEDVRNVYLVMELCQGGQLFDRIIEKSYFTQKQARQVFRQIVDGLVYCHQNHICHRDLKPQNLLYLTKSQDSPIKLIDFGLANIFNEQNKTFNTKVGTRYYMSPQILQGSYNQNCDVWSLGVCLYVFLSGTPPFNGDTDDEITRKIKSQQYTFDSNVHSLVPQFDNVSNSAKQLISQCLTSQNKRIKAKQILSHDWMKKSLKNTLLKFNYKSLKQFNNFGKLKKIALSYIASQLNENEIGELGKIFKAIDKNGDGFLTIQQIKGGLQNSGIKKTKQIHQIINAIDTDGNGKINYTQFLAATLDKSTYLIEQKLYMTFKMFDLDNSGKIDKNELKKVIGSTMFQLDDSIYKNKSDDYWQSIIKQADKNNDGQIDYNQFIQMMASLKIS